MPSSIDTALVQQYSANISMLSQQMTTLLSHNCRKESVNAETSYFDQTGKAEAVEITTRNTTTPELFTPHSRRSVSLKQLVYAERIDEFDKVRMLADPTNTYVRSAAAAIARKKDLEFVAAALGTSQTGKAGTTAVALPASQKIAAGSGAAAGLTLDKILEASEILNSNDVDPLAKRFMAISPRQLTEMLKLPEITSSDFIVKKSLMDGQVTNFMGFHFIVSNYLSTDANSDRQVIAWVDDGILCGTGKVQTNIDVLPTGNYDHQIYHREFVGFTRMEEAKVVEIACTEA